MQGGPWQVSAESGLFSSVFRPFCSFTAWSALTVSGSQCLVFRGQDIQKGQVRRRTEKEGVKNCKTFTSINQGSENIIDKQRKNMQRQHFEHAERRCSYFSGPLLPVGFSDMYVATSTLCNFNDVQAQLTFLVWTNVKLEVLLLVSRWMEIWLPGVLTAHKAIMVQHNGCS